MGDKDDARQGEGQDKEEEVASTSALSMARLSELLSVPQDPQDPQDPDKEPPPFIFERISEEDPPSSEIPLTTVRLPLSSQRSAHSANGEPSASDFRPSMDLNKRSNMGPGLSLPVTPISQVKLNLDDLNRAQVIAQEKSASKREPVLSSGAIMTIKMSIQSPPLDPFLNMSRGLSGEQSASRSRFARIDEDHCEGSLAPQSILSRLQKASEPSEGIVTADVRDSINQGRGPPPRRSVSFSAANRQKDSKGRPGPGVKGWLAFLSPSSSNASKPASNEAGTVSPFSKASRPSLGAARRSEGANESLGGTNASPTNKSVRRSISFAIGGPLRRILGMKKRKGGSDSTGFVLMEGETRALSGRSSDPLSCDTSFRESSGGARVDRELSSEVAREAKSVRKTRSFLGF